MTENAFTRRLRTWVAHVRNLPTQMTVPGGTAARDIRGSGIGRPRWTDVRGPDITDLIRLGATYVDKTLQGAKPADLPIEQPTTLILSMNLAKSLALTSQPRCWRVPTR